MLVFAGRAFCGGMKKPRLEIVVAEVEVVGIYIFFTGVPGGGCRWVPKL